MHGAGCRTWIPGSVVHEAEVTADPVSNELVALCPPNLISDLAFSDQDSAFRLVVCGLSFRVYGALFRVWGEGLRV